MTHILRAFALTVLSATLTRAGGGTPVETELEGRLDDVVVTGTGVDLVVVMGVTVAVPEETVIHSPVAELTVEDLLGESFPGRTQAGFLDGTAIVIGETVDGLTTAALIEVEPAENVLAGPVTRNDNGQLWVLDTPVVMIEDWRMKGVIATEDGFEIDPATTPVDSLAVAEGYMADDGVFYAHSMQAIGNVIGDPNQTAITRAQCRNHAKLEIRGASTTPTGVARFFDHQTNEFLGAVFITPDADNPPFGRFRFDVLIDDCIHIVRVENSNGSSAVADVEER